MVDGDVQQLLDCRDLGLAARFAPTLLLGLRIKGVVQRIVGADDLQRVLVGQPVSLFDFALADPVGQSARST